MKKNVIVILIIFQLLLLFFFQNLYFLFKELEVVNLNDLTSKNRIMENIKQMKKIFSVLSILIGIFLIVSGVYLVIVYKRSKTDLKLKNLSPLQDYLQELRDSEIELKEIVEKQQENVFRKEELSRCIINNINSAILFLNHHGKIDTINSRTEKMFGQSYAHAKNNSLKKILEAFPELTKFVKAHPDMKISSEVVSKEKIFWLDLIPIPRMGLLIIIKDITEEKRREGIERKNKNFIMLGEMTAFLTHEIRNSLGVVYGYLKSIKSEIDELKKGKIATKVDRVNKEIELLSATMESFLNFSKPIKVDKKESINLVGLLRRIAKDKNMKIILTRNDIFFETDPVLLTSIFSNLILNAKEAQASQIDVQIKLNDYLEIYLKDNGKGIDQKIQEKIWLPLFTTKEKGTGMGLAIVRKMVNTLKGEIQLMDSTPGATSFRIIFYK